MTTEAQRRASAKWNKNHPEDCRATSARYFDKHKEEKRKTMIIYRIKQGFNVKQSTLQKYNLNPADYNLNQSDYNLNKIDFFSLKEQHL